MSSPGRGEGDALASRREGDVTGRAVDARLRRLEEHRAATRLRGNRVVKSNNGLTPRSRPSRHAQRLRLRRYILLEDASKVASGANLCHVHCVSVADVPHVNKLESSRNHQSHPNWTLQPSAVPQAHPMRTNHTCLLTIMIRIRSVYSGVQSCVLPRGAARIHSKACLHSGRVLRSVGRRRARQRTPRRRSQRSPLEKDTRVT